MKLPRILTIRQACILAIAAAAMSLFLLLFTPMAIWVMSLISFLAGCYAGVLQWAPELVAAELTPLKKPI